MGQLYERMAQDLVLRNFSPATRRIYIAVLPPIRGPLDARAGAGLRGRVLASGEVE
jgi:hypothetical protein